MQKQKIEALNCLIETEEPMMKLDQSQDFTQGAVAEIQTENVFPILKNVPPPILDELAERTRKIRANAKKRLKKRPLKPKKFDTSTLPKDGLTRLIDSFLNGGKKKKHGYFEIKGGKLIHTAPIPSRVRIYEQNTFGVEHVTVIAKKINGHLIGNSSILPHVNRTCAFGHTQTNNSETEIQRRLALCIPMLPWTVFAQAKLDLEKTKILARGVEEKITRKYYRQETQEYKSSYDGKMYRRKAWVNGEETVHFTGASLFSVQGKTYLFDIDRREITHKIFNPFLVEIPKKVKTIEDAYHALKPKAVLDAEKKGLNVQRQGEWFFIPVDKKTERKIKKLMWKFGGEVELRVGQNRPNTVQAVQLHRGKALKSVSKMFSHRGPNEQWRLEREENERRAKLKNVQTFVYGTARHTGREHADLHLKGVCIAIPNTAFRSFTITGDVD